ncbi:MAG: cupin domain-containing protein [Chloroflexi bacterium]|nr:cupin domain-containing protein [Chloroflexota bacterium]
MVEQPIVRVGVLALLLALSLWLAVGLPSAVAQTAPPPISSTLVATQEMSAVPDGRRWVIRGEHPLNTQHAHAGGFVYVMKGSMTLQMEGGSYTLQESQGMWVPEGIPHTHQAAGDTLLWTFTLESAGELAATPAVFSSKELTGYSAGPHLARLVADQYQAGATTPPHRHYGPEAVFVREGEYQLNYGGAPRSYPANNGYTVEPLVPHQLKNAAQTISKLFNLSLVPRGRQAGETLQPDALR